MFTMHLFVGFDRKQISNHLFLKNDDNQCASGIWIFKNIPHAPYATEQETDLDVILKSKQRETIVFCVGEILETWETNI